MSDERFEYPLELINRHILGCFEASKACALLPGKPHLFHSEFLKRDDKTVKQLIHQNAPVDYYTEIKYSPCPEVSWYLHTREKLPVFENQGAETPDLVYVAEHAEGKVQESYISDIVKANAESIIKGIGSPIPEKTEAVTEETYYDLFNKPCDPGCDALGPHPGACSVPFGKLCKRCSRIITRSEADDYCSMFCLLKANNFGCLGCVQGTWEHASQQHSRACKSRKSRFEKINEELNEKGFK